MIRIFNSIKTGILRAAGCWKGILILWFVSMVMACMIALPMKASFQNDLGASMITEKLRDGINIDVFTDLASGFSNITSYFSKGLFILILAGFLTNSFFSGGLFFSLKDRTGSFSTNEFFRASSKYFWSFLVILLTLSIVIIILAFLIVILPVIFISQGKGVSDYIVFSSGVILTSVFLFVLIIILLAADYARAWQIIQTQNAGFRAISFGFRQTFRTFFSSYPLMLILLIFQALFMWLVLGILPGIKPKTITGIVLLFFISQFLFIIRLLLKTWRYGSVTRMMEMDKL
jgi:hypothetical protein